MYEGIIMHIIAISILLFSVTIICDFFDLIDDNFYIESVISYLCKIIIRFIFILFTVTISFMITYMYF